MTEIIVPDCLTNQEAREWYVKRMDEYYKGVERFYNDRRDDYALPIGMFCDSGVMSSALEEALQIQKPRKMTNAKLEIEIR